MTQQIDYTALVPALLELVPVPAVLCADSGLVLLANQAAREILPVGSQGLTQPPPDWKVIAFSGIPGGTQLRIRPAVSCASGSSIEHDLQWERNRRILLEQVVEALDEGVHAVDQDGITLVYNRAMALMEGRHAPDMLGRSVYDSYSTIRPETSSLLQVLYNRQARYSEYQTYWSRDSRKVTAINHTFPLDSGGEPSGAMEIAKDVTMIERLYEELNQVRGLPAPGRAVRTAARATTLSGGTRYSFGDLIGSDPRLHEAIRRARQAANTSSPVLVYGETGTGKEVIAQAIHSASGRSKEPFVGVNCAALPDTLLEGILFGTVRGSFTGSADRPGLFEQANGGTLFLDELDSMSVPLQAKLLRVLEEHVVRRVGGTFDIQLDVRITATCATDPLLAVELGKLRRDLYYRLAVVTIELPPLRDRAADVEQLSAWFLDRLNRKLHRRIPGFTHEVLSAFKGYKWPGNVRELEHTIEGVINIMDNDRAVRLQDLPPAFRHAADRPIAAALDSPPPPAGGQLTLAVAASQREVIVKALDRNGGNISRAARDLGMSRQSLQYRLRKLGITGAIN